MPSPITVTGLIVDEANNVVQSGYVQFDLSPLNQSLAYEVPGVCVVAKTVRGLIDATGHVKNIDGVSPLLIWPNDLLLPSNTLYTITIAPNNVVTRVYQNVLLQSNVNPQDLSQLTFIAPQPVIGTVIEGSPLVTESVIPAVDLAYSLGDPTHRYTHVYANELDNNLTDLTVDTLHVKNFVDNPLLGQPLHVADDLLVDGGLELGNCIVWDTDAHTHTDQLCPATGANFNHQLPATNGTLAPLDSPTFVNTPTAPTPPPADNSNRLATTAFVQAFVAPTSPVTSVFGRIGAVAAQAGDYNVAQVTGAAPINNPVLTGDPQSVTPPLGDNDTSIATTAFVQAAISASAGITPTKTVLGGNVSLPANTLTSVITKVFTFPVGGPWRIDIRYGLWATVGPNVIAAMVHDTTNNIKYAFSGANSNGTGYEGLTASEISSGTYAGGATVTFVLKAEANSGATATVQSGAFGGSFPSSFLELTPVLV